MLCHNGSLCAFVIFGIAERQGLCDTHNAQRCMIQVIIMDLQNKLPQYMNCSAHTIFCL